jgi:hypothetical protein
LDDEHQNFVGVDPARRAQKLEKHLWIASLVLLLSIFWIELSILPINMDFWMPLMASVFAYEVF